ncbi:class I SAM-dependent rRNA methyltransferase [Methylomonas paludis]|uniref:Class I SAM-dependent rRNA methyltransferase n=1 Tax=Methylomonas paludis TaxID=1173101 RepID=A0A975MPX5_9GAMM|nr:class I SAM-dependent rRNA methyltransferase [Methylomonas paludis]QWF71770.1 class I SAM-dependent rRNA methyltransferase [Methylomonas paludis]
MSYPQLFLQKHEDKRLRQGHLWVFSNEVDTGRSPLSQFAPGDLVSVHDHAGKALGVAYVNPNALICARLLSRKPAAAIGEKFFTARLSAALELRQRLFEQPYYRLVFAESDGLPGLVIDRFGQVLSVQITTAGMEKHKDLLIDILLKLLNPTAILLKNDTSQRQLENLSLEPVLAYGDLADTLEIIENNCRFHINVADGQKTGWFYDHRLGRAQFAQWAQGLKVLDLFSYAGGWGIPAAVAGAVEVTCVDSSESALALAGQSAVLNGVQDKMQFIKADVFEFLKQQVEQNQRYDAVVLDPPALIKRKKDFKAGYEAYRRLNHLALQVLNNQGLLVSASCSHHLSRDNLHEILRSSARHIDRHLVILATGGQGPDHPIHPALPESEYLKTYFCAVSSRF